MILRQLVHTLQPVATMGFTTYCTTYAYELVMYLSLHHVCLQKSNSLAVTSSLNCSRDSMCTQTSKTLSVASQTSAFCLCWVLALESSL